MKRVTARDMKKLIEIEMPDVSGLFTPISSHIFIVNFSQTTSFNDCVITVNRIYRVYVRDRDGTKIMNHH